MQIKFCDIKDNSKIIDIRTSLEYEQKCIPKSINIPRFNLLKNPESYLSKEETYYLICNKGLVSLSCAKILNALGYNCASVIGGIESLHKK